MKLHDRLHRSLASQFGLKWMMAVLLTLTCVIGAVACRYAYQQRRSALLQELDLRLQRVATEYEDLVDDFWSLYVSVFSQQDDMLFFYHYFDTPSDEPLPSEQRVALRQILADMAIRDGAVQWIAVYAPVRVVNYLYFTADGALIELPADFAYLPELNVKTDRMEIYPVKRVTTSESSYSGLAIAGGVPSFGNLEGSVLANYNITGLVQLCQIASQFDSLQFDITAEGESIFTSGTAPRLWSGTTAPGVSGVQTGDGQQWYVHTSEICPHGARISYSVAWGELFWKASSSARMILFSMLFVWVIAAVLFYQFMVKRIQGEIEVIRGGLARLGSNELDYRLPMQFRQPELTVIAGSINQMAADLQQMIARVYDYELRRREAELQELQAKFNPHFLYNTLEIFRARCYENGDEETAELIAQTAANFRGLIGSRNFIPLQEELSASKRYIALGRARHDDEVEVQYDIDTEVLQYGIIRNVFQPLIENYFEHGYDSAIAGENFIHIRGRLADGGLILFEVEDNGLGIPPDRMAQMNQQLQAPIRTAQESYGLKNLYQRLRLFYGEPCGLTLCPRAEGRGLRIEVRVKQMKCGDADAQPGQT